MEHRWGTRMRCQIPVQVEAFAGRRRSAQLENVSVSGAFLRIHITEVLPPTIFLQFSDRRGGLPRRHRILAIVVRQCEGGIGLEWADFAPVAIRVHLGLAPSAINTMRLIRPRASPRIALPVISRLPSR